MKGEGTVGICFSYSHDKQRDFVLKEKNIGWNKDECREVVDNLGENDPLLYYTEYVGLDVGFFYKGHQYWIESPIEDLRGYGDDVWSLAICDHPNPDWDGKYAWNKYLGWERHDANNRTEICHYSSCRELLDNATIDGLPLRKVVENSFITDL